VSCRGGSRQHAFSSRSLSLRLAHQQLGIAHERWSVSLGAAQEIGRRMRNELGFDGEHPAQFCSTRNYARSFDQDERLSMKW
jgi:hypothetical protein